MRWQIGPLTLWGQRLEGEWRISHMSDEDASATSLQHGNNSDFDESISQDSMRRFAIGGSEELLELLPALADRPVVSTPEKPFYVPAGEQVTIYVGTPLWIQIFAGAKKMKLDDFAIHQPSDTWFGPSTRIGEICYASRSFCRLRLDEIAKKPHRAITPVSIHNKAGSPLYLEKILLPVPLLSLYSNRESADLWTNSVALSRIEGEELAPCRIVDGPPLVVPNAQRVTCPRQHSTGGIMVRAFESLFPIRSNNS